MDLAQITPLILTYNEAPNLRRTLDALAWAKEIIIIDSHSTDATEKIARRYPHVRFIQRQFTSFADQCNFGLRHVRTPWVLSLDADYYITEQIRQEIGRIQTPTDVRGYRAAFRYCVFGTPLRACVYPPRTVLYQRESAVYEDDGHAHRVNISGQVHDLQSRCYHDDWKPLADWYRNQVRYAGQEADKILRSSTSGLSLADRIRRTAVIAPLLILPYCLILKRGILDGWAGWYYALQRLLAETLLSLEILDRWLRERAKSNK